MEAFRLPFCPKSQYMFDGKMWYPVTWIFSHPGMLFESYCYKASGGEVFGGSANHLWFVFYNKSHIGGGGGGVGADALAQGFGFQSVLASQFLYQLLLFP